MEIDLDDVIEQASAQRNEHPGYMQAHMVAAAPIDIADDLINDVEWIVPELSEAPLQMKSNGDLIESVPSLPSHVMTFYVDGVSIKQQLRDENPAPPVPPDNAGDSKDGQPLVRHARKRKRNAHRKISLYITALSQYVHWCLQANFLSTYLPHVL